MKKRFSLPSLLALLVLAFTVAPASAQVSGYIWAPDLDWSGQQKALKGATLTITRVNPTWTGGVQEDKPLVEIGVCKPNSAMGGLMSFANCIDIDQSSFSVSTGKDGLPVPDGDYVLKLSTNERYGVQSDVKVTGGVAYLPTVYFYPNSEVRAYEPKMYWFTWNDQLYLGVGLPISNGYYGRMDIAMRMRLRGPAYTAPDSGYGEVPFDGRLPELYSGVIRWAFPVPMYNGNIEPGAKFCLQAEGYHPKQQGWVYFQRTDCVEAQKITWWSSPQR